MVNRELLKEVREKIMLGSIDISNKELLTRIEKTVIESNDVNLIRLFAQKVAGANIPALQEAICSEYKKVMLRDFSERTSLVLAEFVLFAKCVKGADVKSMESIIMDGDESINEVARFLFATQVPEANHKLLLSRVNPKNVILIKQSINKKCQNQYAYIPPKSK